MGHCHAIDRGMQMLIMRILGQGRASELLDGKLMMLANLLEYTRMPIQA